MKDSKSLFVVVSLILCGCASFALNPNGKTRSVHFTEVFTKDEFAARRDRLLDAIGADSVAVVRGNEGMRGYHEFVQNNSMFYLSGVEAPGAILLLDGRDRSSHLFLLPRNARREASEGPVLIADDEAARLTGIASVRSTEDFEGALVALVPDRKRILTPLAPQELEGMSRDLARRYDQERLADPWDGRESRENHFAGLLRDRFPSTEVADLSPVLDRLRLIKSPQEIAVLRKSTDLSVLAIVEAMRSTQPGQFEYELDALGQFIFSRNGAAGLAYYALVAADRNAYMPHYHAGLRKMQDGDFLLYDFGPEYHYYTADVTRMWPVNGKFTADQRELYDFYLRLYKANMNRIRPHVPVRKIVDEIAADWEAILADFKFSRPKYERAARSFVERFAQRRSRRGTPMLGHWVGLATHDVGGAVEELEPGMVLTIEPQFRVPEDETYVRLEDMLLVTEDGVENLSAAAPLEIDAIEKVMAEEGLLQRYERHLPHDAVRPGRK